MEIPMKKWLCLFLLPASLWAAPPDHPETQPTPAARYEALDKSNQMDMDQDSSAFIPPKFRGISMEPVYIDVEADQLTLIAENKVISARDLTQENNEFVKFLDQMEPHKDIHEMVLMLRPGSAVFQRRLRQMIRDRGMTLRFEPWEAQESLTVLVTRPDKTPDPSLKPVFFECRSNQVFSISPDRLRQAVDEKVAEIKAAANGDETEFLKGAAMTTLEVGGHRIDLTYALMGRYMLTMVPDAKGHEIGNGHPETGESGFASELADLDPETHSICFFVRPDSFKTFQRARALAWQKNFTVTLELLNEKEPILLNPPGVIMD